MHIERVVARGLSALRDCGRPYTRRARLPTVTPGPGVHRFKHLQTPRTACDFSALARAHAARSRTRHWRPAHSSQHTKLTLPACPAFPACHGTRSPRRRLAECLRAVHGLGLSLGAGRGDGRLRLVEAAGEGLMCVREAALHIVDKGPGREEG